MATSALIWYSVEVTGHDGTQLDNSAAGSLEMARSAVKRFRALYPGAQWITTNRHKRGRITALISMTVHNGTTAAERREAASKEALEAAARRAAARTEVPAR